MKKRILIIEDESPVIQALTKFLSADYDVFEAVAGYSGLDLALDVKPDLILLDIILPELNGIEILKKIRQDEWGKTAKVVIISNLTDKEMEKSAHELGILEYVVKSATSINVLADKIKGYLED